MSRSIYEEPLNTKGYENDLQRLCEAMERLADSLENIEQRIFMRPIVLPEQPSLFVEES